MYFCHVLTSAGVHLYLWHHFRRHSVDSGLGGFFTRLFSAIGWLVKKIEKNMCPNFFSIGGIFITSANQLSVSLWERSDTATHWAVSKKLLVYLMYLAMDESINLRPSLFLPLGSRVLSLFWRVGGYGKIRKNQMPILFLESGYSNFVVDRKK